MNLDDLTPEDVGFMKALDECEKEKVRKRSNNISQKVMNENADLTPVELILLGYTIFKSISQTVHLDISANIGLRRYINLIENVIQVETVVLRDDTQK